MENNNSTENSQNHFMEKKENGGGLPDETLNIFRQFMAMAAVKSLHPGLDLGADHAISTGRRITNLLSNFECLF